MTIPGTDIDQPICQAPIDDPSYYLTHDVYRNYNIYGCPYLDAGCASQGTNSPLAMVLGHHMNDGSMFAEIADYSSRAFAEKHDEILLQTPESREVLDVFAIDVVDTWSEFKQLDFDNEESLITWAKETVDASDIPLASVPKGTESVKAFVTCSYGRWNGHERTVVYACEEAGELK